MIYITEMLRWGDTETHHYIVGAYSTMQSAELVGEIEKSWRGGKYDYRIVTVNVDEPLDIRKLDNHKMVMPVLATDNLCR